MKSIWKWCNIAFYSVLYVAALAIAVPICLICVGALMCVPERELLRNGE
jgi:hypothetical protein